VGNVVFSPWFDKETFPREKESLPHMCNELKCLKEEVIQLRTQKRKLTHMLVSLSVVIIALVGIWLIGHKAMH
jgi:hypothetical protein